VSVRSALHIMGDIALLPLENLEAVRSGRQNLFKKVQLNLDPKKYYDRFT
jgi:hypothetical protein